MEIKITVWIFQATTKPDCTRNNLNMDKKNKAQKQNSISFHSIAK